MVRKLVFIGIWIIVLQSVLFAQKNGQAKKILDRVSEKYQTYKTAEVLFSYVAKDRNNKSLGVSNGTLLLDLPGSRYRVSMEGQDIISDGKTQWHVMKDIDEVQVSDVAEDSGLLTPANVFSFYKTGYQYSLQPDEKDLGKSLYVIRLDPQDKRKPVNFIKLRVDKTSSLIHDVTVYDKNGGNYRYSIKKLDTDRPIQSSAFVFDKSKYAGMEIVDLR